MAYSELILIALILLIVFAGAQVQKLVHLLRGKNEEVAPQPQPLKTLISAADTPVKPKKVPVKKVAHKKMTAKKSVKRKK